MPVPAKSFRYCCLQFFFSCMPNLMAKQEKRVYKKLGRPAGRTYVGTIPVRFTPDGLAAVDAWINQQDEEISRSEAIRRLVERGLKYRGK